MKSILVYCGSSQSIRPGYEQMAKRLGELLAERSLELVYGGGSTGLMGVLADAVMAAEGVVTGFIPKSMASREVAHYGITRLHVVENMHLRKAGMMELADAIIALPGGLGTLEEWAEAMTWLNLGYHNKPCGLLNHDGFYDPLIQQLNRMHADGFLRDDWMNNVTVADDPSHMLDELEKCCRIKK